MPQNTERLGETRMMNCGMKATIIKYNKYNDISKELEKQTIIKILKKEGLYGK